MALFSIRMRGSAGIPVIARGWRTEVLVIISVLCTTLLVALVALVVAIFRMRTKDRLLRQNLEQGDSGITRLPAMKSLNKQTAMPRRMFQRRASVPFNSQSGWATLDSREDLSKTVQPKRKSQERGTSQTTWRNASRRAWLCSKRASSNGVVPLAAVRNNHLSAIIESPAIMPPRSPGAFHDIQLASSPRGLAELGSFPASSCQGPLAIHEPFCSSAFAPATKSPDTELFKPKPLTVTKKGKRCRAQTVGTADRPISTSPENNGQATNRNIYSHSRSFSLGSQNPGVVPKAPAPPLPLKVASAKPADRPRSWGEGNSSRLSISSLESIGSSLLAASPHMQRVSSAWLKGGPKRDYANSLIVGPRPLRANSTTRADNGQKSSPERNLQSLRGSIRSNHDRFSVLSLESQKIPMDAGSSTVASSVWPSPAGKMATVETVRASRVSIVSTTKSSLIQNTPRRQSRYLVTPNGSPAQRRRPVSRDSPMSQRGPTRQLSQTSSQASSTRSSNGNPFQFDPSPMASGRPSALKGSPNARNRGHRRQNCVRISVPVPSKSSSPIMAGIEEESPEAGAKDSLGHVSSCANRSLPRPPSTSTFAPDIKLNPTLLRASLTPNSPTLPMVPLANYPSSRESSMPCSASSPFTKDSKRLSITSSIVTIPIFPKPGNLTTDMTPTPTFSFTRPSNEFDNITTPPAEFRRLAKPIVPDKQLTDIVFQNNDYSDHSPEMPYFVLPTSGITVQDEAKSVDHDPAGTSLGPQDPWTAPPKYTEKLTPMSPPCSPKSMPLMLEESFAARKKFIASQGDSLSFDPTPTATQQAYDVSIIKTVRPMIDSIYSLRRMNSEAERELASHGLRAMKTWQHLGQRATSPAVDRSESRYGSFADSLLDIDRFLEGCQSKNLGESGEEEEEVVDIDRVRQDRELLSAVTFGSSYVQNPGKTSQTEKENKEFPSVWEDGEHFWHEKPDHLAEEEVDNPLPLATTMNSQNRSGRVSKVALPQRISQMRKSAILENPFIMEKLAAAVSGIGGVKFRMLPPSDIIETTGSLYDENEVLRCS